MVEGQQCICDRKCVVTEDQHYINCPAHEYHSQYLAMTHPDEAQTNPPLSGAFITEIWIARIAGLQSHLRIIAEDVRGCDNIHLQRIGRQAQAGIAEAERYLAEPDWDHCSNEEKKGL